MELLRPLYDLLISEVFHSDYVQSDESTVPVIDNEKGQAEKEYLWTSRAVMERLAVFFYDKGFRTGEVIKSRTDRYGFSIDEALHRYRDEQKAKQRSIVPNDTNQYRH
ncbi:MAG: transposase [Clostridia bacterium]|nr:transposase [Clostridia bacterium]